MYGGDFIQRLGVGESICKIDLYHKTYKNNYYEITNKQNNNFH